MEYFKISLLALLFCTLSLPGCGGGSTLTITLTPNTTQTINQGQSVNITAAVANDSTNQGVSWTLTGVGSLNNQTPTSVTYAAPDILSTNTSVTVTATSVAKTTITATLTVDLTAILTITTSSLPIATLGQPYVAVISADGGTSPFNWLLQSGNLPPGLALSQSTGNSITVSGTPIALGTTSFSIGVTDSEDGSASKSFSITVNPKPPLAIATKSLPDAVVNSAYSFSLQAVNGTTPYSWTLINGTLPNGLSLSSSGLISGTPTAPGTSTFTVQVTDSSSPSPQTATAQLSLTVDASRVDNALLQGNYAFLVRGFDSSGLFVAAGSFVADGAGNVTSGIMDTNDPLNVQLSQGLGATTYSIDTSGLGTIALGSRSFAISLNPADNTAATGSMIEFDGLAQASGVLLKQTPASFSQASITGGYAFGLAGVDGQGARYGFAGQFNADGAGNFSGSLDSDDASAGAVQNNGVTGTYGAPNPATGRGTATISIGQDTTNYSFYVVDGTQLLMMEIDQISGQPRAIVGGNMLQQSGSFTSASLSGTGVFETTALSSGTPQAQLGLLTANGSSDISLTADLNTGGTLTSPMSQCNPTACTYAVAPNGRVTLSNSGFQTSDPVLYLVNQNRGFVIGTDAAVTFGFMENQVGANTFSAASLSGTYPGGSVAPINLAANNRVEVGIADGVSAIDLTTDNSNPRSQNQTSIASYTMSSSGRGTVTGSSTSIIYMTSASEFFELSPDVNAMVEIFQQ